MDGGAWRAARLGDFTFTFHFHALEKEMAAHWSGLENPRGQGSLENPGDRGAWRAAVYGVAQSRTRLKRLSSSSSSSSRVGNEEMLPPCGHLPQQQPENYSLGEQTQVC